MKLNKKQLIKPLICIVGLSGIFYAGKTYANHKESLKYEVVHVPEVKQEEKKVLVKKPVIQEINKLGELKVLEIKTKQETIFEDDQWYGKKEMKADLFYNTQFFISFNLFTEESLVQDTEDENKYYLMVTLPRCETHFDESKTVEHRTKNTGINYGRYETNLREFDAIKANLKKTINQSVQLGSMEIAKDNTRLLLAPIIDLVNDEGFDIEIKFVQE